MKTILLLVGVTFAACAAPVANARTTLTAAQSCWTPDDPHQGASFNTTTATINVLYGTGTTGAVSYAWSQVSGPSTATFGTPSISITTVGNLVFGTYVFRLLATAMDSSTNTFDITVGAVAADQNWVVIPVNPDVTKLLGPMMAFGRNPWCKQDRKHKRMYDLQSASAPYPANTTAWSTLASGTTSWPFAGIGSGVSGGAPGATLCSNSGGQISASATSINICNAERITGLLGLPATPTWIMIGNPFTGEMVRASSTTSTSGPATLTIDFDGRGLADYPYGSSNVAHTSAAAIHLDGAVVSEMRIVGSGTSFATDAQRPIVPGGVPGPPGPVNASSSTVSVSGLTWTLASGSWSSPAVQAGYMIRVTDTHSSTPFVWWDQIASFNGTNQVTVVGRAWPAGADHTSGLSYKIIGERHMALEVDDATSATLSTRWGGKHLLLQDVKGCQSETVCFAIPAHDIPDFDASTQTTSRYTYKDRLLSVVGGFVGPNMYCPECGFLAYGLRSGISAAIDFGKVYTDHWIRDPEICGGYCPSGVVLTYGGGFVGGAFGVALYQGTGSYVSNASDLRPWVGDAVKWMATNHSVCNNPDNRDTRDQGYLDAQIVLGYFAETDPTFKQTWLEAMGGNGVGGGTAVRDTNCKRSDNSFAIGISFSDATITTIKNDPVVHGAGFTSDLCAGNGHSGTITVTHNSAAATLVTGTPTTAALGNIIIYDTTSSPKYAGFFAFKYASGTGVTLAALWPGASGTFAWMEQDDSQSPYPSNPSGVGLSLTTISLNGLDSDNGRMVESWGCTVNSSTQITLDRPWAALGTDDGLHESGTYHMYIPNHHGVTLGGYFQQPFMYGIRTRAASWMASLVPDATVSAAYKALVPLMAQWFHDVGYDNNTDGSYYARVNNMCEPAVQVKRSTDPPDSSVFVYTNFAYTQQAYCSQGLVGYTGDNSGEFVSRFYSTEAFSAVIEYFKYQCSLGQDQCDAARAFGDRAFGSTWGDCSQTDASVYCDAGGHFVVDELDDTHLNAGRFPGFSFGMGASYQWPAVRLQYIDNGARFGGSTAIAGAASLN